MIFCLIVRFPSEHLGYHYSHFYELGKHDVHVNIDFGFLQKDQKGWLGKLENKNICI